MKRAFDALYIDYNSKIINENMELSNQIFNEIKKSFIKNINSIEWLSQEIKNDNIEKVN